MKLAKDSKQLLDEVKWDIINYQNRGLSQITQKRGLIIHNIMRKPNSIIVLLHIFSGLFTLKCVNFGSFQEQWWKRWSNVFCVHQNFDRITVTISKSLLMAEDTPYPSENLVSPVTCWTDLKRRRQKSFKNEKRKTKKKQRKKTLQLHWRLRSLQKSREVIWATLRFLFLFFFLFLFLFFCFFKWRGSQSNFKHN